MAGEQASRQRLGGVKSRSQQDTKTDSIMVTGGRLDNEHVA